jgi:N-acetylneuraminate synthase/N,N'-diacetyllegionaminate synthase
MRIGGREIGRGRPVYIIAEAGVAHGGSLDRAIEMIAVAMNAGADAVKFQAYHVDELLHGRATEHADYLRKAQLEWCQLYALNDACRVEDIEFLCSPFDVPSVWMLAGLGIRALKIASPVALKLDVMSAALSTSLPMIVSMGMANWLQVSDYVGDDDILLHCRSEYPARWTELDQEEIIRKSRYGVGYSDHTPDVDTGAKAVKAGACILEKHFTLDDTPTPDLCVSLKPDELAEYIKRARAAQ